MTLIQELGTLLIPFRMEASSGIMLYAKLDVCFDIHPKFIAAGPAACGYWAGVLTWLRRNDSTTGILPFTSVGHPLFVGEQCGQDLCDALVKVGLFSVKETGYLLNNYSLKNETKEEIEARREASRIRTARWRSARCNVGDAASRPVTVTLGTGSALSLSVDASDQISTEAQPLFHYDPARVALTAELRAYADMVPLTGVDAVWKKFGQLAVEKQWRFDSKGWSGRWERFCDAEAQYQAKDRERARKGGYGAAMGKDEGASSPSRVKWVNPDRKPQLPKEPTK